MENLNLEKIILPNRDGAYLYLEQIEEGSNLYRLKCDTQHKYVIDYARLILNDDNITINACDPSGGPYLNVGYRIINKTIKAIISIDGDIVFMIGD